MIQPTVLTLTDPGWVGCTASARMKPTTVTISPMRNPMTQLFPGPRNRTARSGFRLAAPVEPGLECAAQQLAGHVARPARDPLRLLAGDADDLAAPVAVAAGVGVAPAIRRALNSSHISHLVCRIM